MGNRNSNKRNTDRKRNHHISTWLDKFKAKLLPVAEPPTKEEQGKPGVRNWQPKRDAARKKKTRRKMAQQSRRINRKK